ncbi:MAG: Hsp20/alpha crystallin family protein [Desulfobacterium sp.]|jgi:HSP20 family protein|nr:Hsp20/alpha crystallin family protein [Desulfobacterium sp.]
MFANWRDIDRVFGIMDLLQGRNERLFDDFKRVYENDPIWGTKNYFPKTNLFDTGENLEIVAEIPAFSKEDLNINVQGNYLEIKGTAKSDAPEGYTPLRTERGINSFARSFTLPVEVDSEKAEAVLKNGVLILKLPKSVAAKPKQISIS